jgi:hypothetical protein
MLRDAYLDPSGTHSVGLLIGKEDATKLDAATGQHGFLAKVARIGLEFGDRDTDYL